jgi:hypothetical protein
MKYAITATMGMTQEYSKTHTHTHTHHITDSPWGQMTEKVYNTKTLVDTSRYA